MPFDLIPRQYRTIYGDQAGQVHYTTWKQWMGRCYLVDDMVIDPGQAAGPTMEKLDELLDVIRAGEA